ncbi:DUF1697 domain-containing protein [Peptostreptococcus porci]|uniref:DUF1697 domain-containing protein n=1 Tax=Peptostreptococcus porci TaxID=2652282 RepID=UPI002A9BA4E0|nr:DUF1697 domain-containing protein [Peptostreptococcus porci]
MLETELSKGETAKLIHDTIAKEIGADLSVIIKEKNQLQIAIKENPFNENYDFSRIHLVFTNDKMGEDELKKLENKDFGDERFVVSSECLYMYLPRSANTKKLNTNYLEKQLSITMTMRKLNVVKHLVGLCEK